MNPVEQKRRELFDAWFKDYELAREASGWMPLESSIRVRMMNAFNAALDAVVIELPRSWNLTESEYRDSCKDAIESTDLGLKVLP
ncbi:hypothetical protein D3C85_1151040 [compost metagenome]